MTENTNYVLDTKKPDKAMTYDSHGSISVKGRRKHMEDALTVSLGFLKWESRKYDYFGVYDGHGGSQVATACRDHLHHLVIKEVEKQGEKVIDWEKVMVTSFLRMDEQVIAERVDGSTGSTAIVVVVGEEVLVVANCGDSRAVLSHSTTVVPLSCDHKPDRPDELERIEVSGGVVVNWNGTRVQGVLATSRSIGDEHLKPHVIAQAEVTVKARSDLDEFIILASDGLWDVMSNEEACKIARFGLERQSQKRSTKKPIAITDENETTKSRAAVAAQSLKMIDMKRGSQDKSQKRSTKKPIAITDENETTKSRAAVAAQSLKMIAMKRGSQDNISVIVIDLNKLSKRSA